MHTSQWERLLKNAGIWQGSFTQFSPEGKQVKNTPSELILEGLNEDKTLKLTLTRENQNPIVNEFNSLNRNIFLFEDGYFAKGSQQFNPYSLFGAEYGFIAGDRRCRLVQLWENQGELSSITLIREFRRDGNGVERSPLSIEQLEGEWVGEAQTLYPDWRTPESYPTRLTIKQQQGFITQTLVTPEINFTSEGKIEGNTITFNQGNLDIRVLLLPDGASSTTPLTIKTREKFFVEFGWLVEPHKRLRLIRQYDEQGGWVSVTLVTESKVS